MKKYFIVFGLVFILSANPVSAFSGNGIGTSEDPYQITSCSELQEINDERSASYVLMNDIDCAESANWNVNLDEWEGGDTDNPLIPDSYASTTDTDVIVENNGYFGFSPIGTMGTSSEAYFTGTLDGDGYTISNLWIFRKSENNIGIIGVTSGATIRDIGLRDSNIVGQYSVGGIVGSMSGGTASNIVLEDNMVRAYLSYQGGGFAGEMVDGVVADNITNTGGVVHGSGSVIGGIVGKLEDSSIDDSHSSADVDGGDQIGGFVGAMYSGNINNSYATGNVRTDRLEVPIVKSGNYAGGFAGYIQGGSVDDSYATGDVEVTGNRGGGFAGSINTAAVITDSYATGDVTGIQETIGETTYDAPYSIGGFVGEFSQSSLSHTYATGNVVNGGVGTGGFSGTSGCGSEISYSHALGNVTGEDFTGGFTGDDACEGPGSTFDQVFATGDVSGDQYVGGFGGRLNVSTISNAYSSGPVTGNSYVGGFAGELYYTDADNVYSRGEVISSGDEFIGAFVGKNFNDGEAIEGFWDNSVVYTFSGCGTGVEAECIGVEDKNGIEMRTQSTFEDAGYDFEDIWVMNENNNGYPYFYFASEPMVVSVVPDVDSNDISITSDIVIEFSHSLDTEISPIVTSGPCDGSCPSFDEVWSGMGSVLTLTKTGEPFAYGTTYTISIDGLETEDGTPVDSFEWSFTTEDDPNITAPEESNRSGSRRRAVGRNSNSSTNLGTTTVRNLTLTFTGDDVKKLQEILIAKNSGPKALALSGIGSTGYFGTYTRNALAEYQSLNGIAPSIGYFGPLTRAQMKAVGLEGLWW
jgi:hypothetical protein